MLFISVILCCCVLTNADLFKNDPKLQKIKEECAKQARIEPNKLQDLEQADLEDEKIFNKNAKCYVSCVMEKSELAKAGPPNLKTIKQFLDFTDDHSFVEIIKKCWGKDSGDKCESRFVMFKCIMGDSKKTLKGMNSKDNKENKDGKQDGKKSGDDDKQKNDNKDQSTTPQPDSGKQDKGDSMNKNENKKEDNKDDKKDDKMEDKKEGDGMKKGNETINKDDGMKSDNKTDMKNGTSESMEDTKKDAPAKMDNSKNDTNNH